MSVPVVDLVVVNGIAEVDVVHNLGDISPTAVNNEVGVVIHDTICQDSEFVGPQASFDEEYILILIILFLEHLDFADAAHHHMVNTLL
jgi:hypothetical protein